MRTARFLAHESLENRQLLDAGGVPAAGEPVPSVLLTDVNETSPTFGEMRSAGNYVGQTTAWYFIRSW